MKDIAIYIRVSTEEQVEKGNSLIEQEDRLRSYCLGMDLPGAIKVYKDDGYSAGSMKRPQLTKMLKDVRDKKVGMVIVTKLDRLCRNLRDLLTLVDDLDEMQCGFASASERFDTSTAAGRVVLQVLGAFAEFERSRVSERVKENMMSLAKKTTKAISRPCFGYDVIDSKYVINEAEAAIVREMAEWMLDGYGAHAIMQKLNARGLKTKDGKSFTQRAVGKLMKRETLAGTLVYNRTYTFRGKTLVRPKEEWVISENHHEAILDQETFDRIQLVVDSRRTSRKQADNDRWLLTSIVRCSHCDSPMFGRHRKKQSGREYYHYVCSSYMKKAECFHHFTDRDGLETAVLDFLKKSEFISTGRAKEQIASNATENKSDIDKVKSKLNKLDIKMQRQIELYEEAEIDIEDFRKARERIDQERKSLLEEINEYDQMQHAEAEKRFSARVDGLKNDLNSEVRSVQKNALRQLIKSVIVTDSTNIKIDILL